MQKFIIIGVIAFGVQPLWGEPGAVVTLATVGDRVRAQNPDLAAARLTIDEAVGRMKQAGRLENPDLEIGTQYNTTSAERGLEIGFSQKFPVTHRLKLEKDRGATAVMAAQAEIREVENQLIGEARAALVKVLAVRERKALIEQQSRLSRELADFIEGIAKKGEASVIEAGQARLEAARFTTESRQLAAEEERAVGELKPLLGMTPGETLHVSGGLPGLRLPEGADQIERPALEVARLAVVAAEQDVAIEQARRYGDLTAGFFAGAERVVDAPEAAAKEGIVGLRVTIPLPFWDKNEGNIEAAEARAKRRRKEVVALRQGIALEAEAARAEMLEWAKLATEIGNQLLPQAEEQTGVAEQAWRNGQGDLLTVFRSREQRLDLAAARLEALQNFQLARARYQTALGNP